MDRAAIGLGSVFLHLDAKLNWYKLFHELIDGFNEDSLKKDKEMQSKGLKWSIRFKIKCNFL